jgi:hypothetical protein
MSARTPLAAVLFAATTVISIVGCSSSKSAETTPPTRVTTPSATVPSASSAEPTTAPPTVVTTAASTATTSSASSSDDTAAITAAFTTFFDGLDPNVDAKIAVLQHGDLLGSMVVDAAKDPQFQQLSTVVNSVAALSDADCAAAGEVAPCALVHHDMFLGGLPAMVDLKSHAVRISGVWKVSASSWCAVVTLGGATCPALPAG